MAATMPGPRPSADGEGGNTWLLSAPVLCYLCIAGFALAHARDALGRPAALPAE